MVKARMAILTATAVVLAGSGIGLMPPAVGVGGPCGGTATGASGEFASGSGSATDPYLIANEAQLRLASDSGCLGKTFVQTADIDLSPGGSWTKIGTNDRSPFTGTFYGNDCFIDNLSFSSSTVDFVGMFGETNGATLGHIRLRGIAIDADEEVGGLVGAPNPATITDVTISGTVSGSYYTGGVVGMPASGTTSLTRVAYLSGSVTGTSNSTGGIVGRAYNDTQISQAFSLVPVTARYKAGGLLGTSVGGSNAIINSFSTGGVSASSSDARSGGLVGTVGSNLTVTSSYATGAVGGSPTTVGGLAGEYVAGSSSPPFTTPSSFWDTTTTGRANTATSSGPSTTGAKTTAEMQTSTTFTGATPAWDASIWNFAPGAYPTLKWFVPWKAADDAGYSTCAGIRAVTPSTGSTTGSTPVTISGGGFTAGSTVSIDGAPATSVVVVNSTTITADFPPGTASAPVVIVTPGPDLGITLPPISKSGVFSYGSGGGVTPVPAPAPAPAPVASSSSTPRPTQSPTATATPVDAALDLVPDLGNPNIPTDGVPQGASVYLVNGQPAAVTVTPNAKRGATSLDISGPDFTMKLSGTGDDADPLGLTQSNALILQSKQQRDRAGSLQRSGVRAKCVLREPMAVSSGTGFKANSQVKMFILPSTYIGELPTDGSGSYSGSLPVPVGVLAGSQTLQANGRAPSGAVRSLSLGILVKRGRVVTTREEKASVFFDPMSPVISPDGKATLDAVVTKAGKQGLRTVAVGFVQQTPTTSNDDSLSTQRARNVASYLRSRGLRGALVVRGDGIAGPGDTARRVNVSAVYQSGC